MQNLKLKANTMNLYFSYNRIESVIACVLLPVAYLFFK